MDDACSVDEEEIEFGWSSSCNPVSSHEPVPEESIVNNPWISVNCEPTDNMDMTLVQKNLHFMAMNPLYVHYAVVVAAILLFVGAQRVVRSTVLYYLFGAIMGILLSFVVIMLGVHKLLPGFLPIPIYLGGLPIIFYIYYKAWLNLPTLLQSYSKFFLTYVTAVTFVSLAACYRFGPPTDPRTLDLAQWSLQLVCLAAIYFACQTKPLSIAIIVALASGYLYWASTAKSNNKDGKEGERIGGGRTVTLRHASI